MASLTVNQMSATLVESEDGTLIMHVRAVVGKTITDPDSGEKHNVGNQDVGSLRVVFQGTEVQALRAIFDRVKAKALAKVQAQNQGNSSEEV